jgi:hypothetical protein
LATFVSDLTGWTWPTCSMRSWWQQPSAVFSSQRLAVPGSCRSTSRGRSEQPRCMPWWHPLDRGQGVCNRVARGSTPRGHRSSDATSSRSATARLCPRAASPTSPPFSPTRYWPSRRSSCAGRRSAAGRPRRTGSSGNGASTKSGSAPTRKSLPLAPAGALSPLIVNGNTLSVPMSGRYELWVGGSVRGELTAFVQLACAGGARRQEPHARESSAPGAIPSWRGRRGVTDRPSGRHTGPALRPLAKNDLEDERDGDRDQRDADGAPQRLFREPAGHPRAEPGAG